MNTSSPMDISGVLCRGEHYRYHGYIPSHVEMIFQVSMSYSSIPDVRTMKVSEIRFFYKMMSLKSRKS